MFVPSWRTGEPLAQASLLAVANAQTGSVSHLPLRSLKRSAPSIQRHACKSFTHAVRAVDAWSGQEGSWRERARNTCFSSGKLRNINMSFRDTLRCRLETSHYPPRMSSSSWVRCVCTVCRDGTHSQMHKYESAHSTLQHPVVTAGSQRRLKSAIAAPTAKLEKLARRAWQSRMPSGLRYRGVLRQRRKPRPSRHMKAIQDEKRARRRRR